MHRSSERCSKVGWARSDVTKMIVMSEFGMCLDLSSSNGKSTENSSDISSLLHGDNSELILFVDPNEESLLVVMEDASSLGPVPIEASCFEESVSFLE